MLCTVAVILVDFFTEFAFCGLACFPSWRHHFLTLSSLWKEMGIDTYIHT